MFTLTLKLSKNYKSGFKYTKKKSTIEIYYLKLVYLYKSMNLSFLI